MSGHRDLPHPRKLYSMLLEAPSPQARAQAVSDFLCSCVGAEAIHLFLARGDELALVVSSPGETVTPELTSEAKRVWSRDLERQPDDQKTKTLDVSALELMRTAEQTSRWQSPSGSYERRILGVYRESRWVPVGIAMLKTNSDRALAPIRQAHIESICNALLDAGDVSDSAAPVHSG
jgi:hypothetical protein